MDAKLCTAKPKETQTIEMADILRSLGEWFIRKQKLAPRQAQAFRNIVECRTAAKGGHLWRCSSCGEHVNEYNSCLDRHCPKCGGKARFKWVAARMSELINTPYFHVVFTLPHELNSLISFNPSLLNLLFQAASRTLLLFGRDPKYLGGEVGFITVLHTWNQKLQKHYHLHCIVPAGALSYDGQRWLAGRNPHYLFPVQALSKTFRRLYWHGTKRLSPSDPVRSIAGTFKGLQDLLTQGALNLPQDLKRHQQQPEIKALENRLYRKRWNVYAKRPFGGPAQVLKYLGCYTHRVAISNRRLLSHRKGRVTFSWKDRKNVTRPRTLELAEEEFAKRFLQHVMPRGFMKIRSYGFLSSRRKKHCLQQCKKLLGEPDLPSALTTEESEAQDTPRICPHCQKPCLELVRRLSRCWQVWARRLLWDTS